MGVHVLDRLGERVDHADRHLHPQELGVPVGVVGVADIIPGGRLRPTVADQHDPGVGEIGEDPGRKAPATLRSPAGSRLRCRTPGRSTFALKAIRRAISRSASACT